MDQLFSEHLFRIYRKSLSVKRSSEISAPKSSRGSTADRDGLPLHGCSTKPICEHACIYRRSGQSCRWSQTGNPGSGSTSDHQERPRPVPPEVLGGVRLEAPGTLVSTQPSPVCLVLNRLTPMFFKTGGECWVL